MHQSEGAEYYLFNLVDEVYGRAVIDIVIFNLPIVDVLPIENVLVELEIPADDLAILF